MVELMLTILQYFGTAVAILGVGGFMIVLVLLVHLWVIETFEVWRNERTVNEFINQIEEFQNDFASDRG